MWKVQIAGSARTGFNLASECGKMSQPRSQLIEQMGIEKGWCPLIWKIRIRAVTGEPIYFNNTMIMQKARITFKCWKFTSIYKTVFEAKVSPPKVLAEGKMTLPMFHFWQVEKPTCKPLNNKIKFETNPEGVLLPWKWLIMNRKLFTTKFCNFWTPNGVCNCQAFLKLTSYLPLNDLANITFWTQTTGKSLVLCEFFGNKYAVHKGTIERPSTIFSFLQSKKSMTGKKHYARRIAVEHSMEP